MRTKMTWGYLLTVFAVVPLLLCGGAPTVAAQAVQDTSAQKSPALQNLENVKSLIKAGKYAEAELQARELLAQTQAKHGSDAIETAEVLDALVEALWRGGKAKQPESRELAEQAVAIKENTLGPDHPDVAKSLNNLGILLRITGDYAGARPLYERALAIQEKALDPDHPDVAQTLNDLGILLSLTGDYAGARPLYERALAIWEKALGPDHPHVAASLNNLATLLRETGDYAGARPLYERALAIDEKAHGPDHPAVAGSLNNLAILLYFTGDYAGARPLYERALAIDEKALGPDHPRVAASLNNLAIVHWDVGDYAGARPLYERALAIDEKALGSDHPSVAARLNNLGVLLKITGDYAGARPLYERALAIREKALGPDHPDVAGSLNNLAMLLGITGDYAGARPLYERALAIKEKALGPDHPSVAASLNNLATLLRETGDYAGARLLYERALAIREKALGPDHPSVAASLNNLANLLRETGDYGGARPLYERALAIREKALGPDHPDVAKSLYSLGVLLKTTGDYAGARPLYERALAIKEKALGPDHPRVASSLNNLANLHWEVGERAGAIQAALRAEEISREHLRLTADTLAERQALRYAAVRTTGLDLAVTITVVGSDEVPAAVGKAWDALINSRALVLDEMAARNRAISGSEDPEIEQLATQLTAARQRLAHLTVRGPGAGGVKRFRRFLDEARKEKEAAERALAEKSAVFRQELAKNQIGFDEVAAALPAGSALVAFARYSHLVRQESQSAAQAAAGKPEPVPSYVAFVMRATDKAPSVTPLGKAEEIETLVARWRKEVEEGIIRSLKQAEVSYRRVGEELRQRIWDPVASHSSGAERVFIVPDGALNLINFSALPVGKSDYLVESRPLIHYLSAERDLVLPETGGAQGEGLLALGGADFEGASLFASLAPGGKSTQEPFAGVVKPARTFRGNRSDCGDFQSLLFKPLPGTQREAQEVIALWSKHKKNVVHLTGTAASEAALKALAPGRQILHLATHGFFLGADCPSALQSAGSAASMSSLQREQPPPITGENPLLLSGLALAGANHRDAAGPDEEDGILTAEEIASLDLSGVDWAVLSACDTGVGEVQAGEGVFGLRRAFEVAGAATLIMSLWSVEDEATRQWMNALYEARLVQGLSTAKAVREASLTVLRKRRGKGQSTHPFFWAGFVAAGDWR